MDRELRCPVCNEYFAEPVMLQCTHHVCLEHIGSVANRDRLACPVCSEVTAVPEGGLPVDKVVESLVTVWRDQKSNGGNGGSQKASAVCGVCEATVASQRCIQCEGVLCEECATATHSKGFFKSHTILPLDDAGDVAADTGEWRPRMLCTQHPEEKLNFYCLDCRTAVCSHCLILGEHKGHQQTQISAAFDTGKDTLRAWVEKLVERIRTTEELLERLRSSEVDVNQGAEAQRGAINQEMDHLKDIIETKRQQLLSKSALEEKQKRMQLQAQVDRTDASRDDARKLIHRSEDLLALPSEHAFLAVVLPLIQDMKKCQNQAIDGAPSVTANFRPLATDAQVRSLGDLDLGYPRVTPSPPPQGVATGQMQQQVVQSMPPQQHHQQIHQHLSAEVQQTNPAGQVLMQGQAYSVGPSQTVAYLPQQSLPVQQVQYVYRSVPT